MGYADMMSCVGLARHVAQAIAALLEVVKPRGLLDEILVPVSSLEGCTAQRMNTGFVPQRIWCMCMISMQRFRT